jgi:hypothetical protein
LCCTVCFLAALPTITGFDHPSCSTGGIGSATGCSRFGGGYLTVTGTYFGGYHQPISFTSDLCVTALKHVIGQETTKLTCMLKKFTK